MNWAEAIQEIRKGKIVKLVGEHIFYREKEDEVVCCDNKHLPLSFWNATNLYSYIFDPRRSFEIYDPAPLDGKTAEIDGRKYKLTAVE